MQRTPVTILTGFLGSGKTTLVNRILSERRSERIAVLVNEFGEVPLDGRLIVRADEEVVELANGCVCCTVRGDLVRGLAGLLARRRARFFARSFERILIETSGVASPGPVLQTLILEEALARELAPAGVIALAHAALLPEQLERHPEAAEQLGYADLVVLNHADRTDAEGLGAAQRAARRGNPLAHVETSVRAELDVGLLLADLEERAADPAPRLMDGDHFTHEARACVLRSKEALELAPLKLWLQFLAARRGQEIWRIKGIVRCAGLEQPVLVQSVYQWLEIGAFDGAPPEESLLVLIGRELDAAELERGWRACGAR